jgi:signal peptidase II
VWRKWFFLLIAAFVVAMDQLTKFWIRANLLPGESLPEIGNLSIAHVQNTGSAFGLFTNQTFLLTLIAIAGLIVILFFYRYLPQPSILSSVALGLVFGGALGNLTDRIHLGYVTDFIYVRLWDDVYWPAFNVADSAVSIGVIVLAAFILFGLKKKDAQASREN